MKQFILIASFLVLASCVTNKYLASSSVKSEEVINQSYFEPFSYIHYVEKGNKSEFSDSLSYITKIKADSILASNKSLLRLTDKIDLMDDTLKARVENEIGYMAQLINQRRKLEGIPLTPTIDSLMESNNQRFSLAIVAAGFGRRKGNYGGQVAKGLGVGLLTLGMVVPTPIKSNLTMHAFIFDSERNEVVFYKRGLPAEKEPTDPEIIEKQIISLFNGYLYENK
jgi:hypothetical protein